MNVTRQVESSRCVIMHRDSLEDKRTRRRAICCINVTWVLTLTILIAIWELDVSENYDRFPRPTVTSAQCKYNSNFSQAWYSDSKIWHVILANYEKLTLARTWNLFLCKQEKLVATNERQKNRVDTLMTIFFVYLFRHWQAAVHLLWCFFSSCHGEHAHLPDRKCRCHVVHSGWLVTPHLYTSFSLITVRKVVSQLCHFIFTTEWGKQLQKVWTWHYWFIKPASWLFSEVTSHKYFSVQSDNIKKTCGLLLGCFVHEFQHITSTRSGGSSTIAISFWFNSERKTMKSEFI